MEQPRVFLDVGTWHERSWANGPGQRFVLWVQGCHQRCPGCVNQQFLGLTAGRRISVDALVRRVLSIRDIEGVTFSGGEPMLQAQGLTLLSRAVRAAGLSVVCYTGYTLESLRQTEDPRVSSLLECIDVLIDGPYRRDLAASLPWRSSRNQEVHFLTDRYRRLQSQMNRSAAEVEFLLGDEGFTTTGTWPEEFLERVVEILRR